ncbi:MAG: aldo/keto reductase [bacterium]|nr:aldo/keto reductase [bacterium]
MKLPLLGMGTWGMGGRFEKDPRNTEESIELLRYGFDLGITLVDVAEIYGEGLTEEILGRAMEGRNREDIIVVSKVWKEHLRYDEVIRAAEGSLKRLNTSYIDLYLIHWPDPKVPLKETMQAMEALVERGLVKEIGVSNFSVPLMQEAQSHLKHTKLSANEIEYNLSSRSAEAEVIPFCREHDIRVIAYRPFAKGVLLSGPNETLKLLSEKYGKTPAQIALNWIMGKGASAIPKAGSKEHLLENAGARGWSLVPEDVRILESAYS